VQQHRDPTSLGFLSRSYQRPFMGAYARGDFDRFYRVWPRRAGKDDCELCARIDHIIHQESLGIIANYWTIFPTFAWARRAMWDNICGHNMRMVEHVPVNARAGRNWLDETNMQAHFRRGSILQLFGAKNPNSVRGPNPVDVALSEWAQCNPSVLSVVRPIVEVNGGTLSFNTTPFGQGHAYKLWKDTVKDPRWFNQLLTVDDCWRDGLGEDGRSILSPPDPKPERTARQAAAQMIAEGEDPDFIEQEFWCSWNGVMTGAFYSRALQQARAEKRIGRFPHIPGLVVHTFWDRGLTNAIWFVQNVGRRRHVIDYLETYDAWLWEILDEMHKGHRAAYDYGRFVAGHDFFDTSDYTTGKSAEEMAFDHGAVFEAAPYISVLDGITAGVKIFPRCYFDEVRCEQGLESLSSYHRKWLEDRKMFSNKPEARHWANHGADAWRYFAVSDDDRPEPSDVEKAQALAVRNLLQSRLPTRPGNQNWQAA
jgi:phage terminase large subunit